MLRDLPAFDESLRIFLDIWFELDRTRDRGEYVKRISRDDVTQLLVWKGWNDDAEFKEDVWYFLNELEDVAIPIEVKQREMEAKAARAKARSDAKHAKFRPKAPSVRG